MFNAPLTLPVVASISLGSLQKSEELAVICETSDLCCLQWHFGAFMLEELARLRVG